VKIYEVGEKLLAEKIFNVNVNWIYLISNDSFEGFTMLFQILATNARM